MGHKVHPYGIRIGIVKTWSSQWFGKKKEFPDLIEQDHKVRAYVKKLYENAGVSKVDITRAGNKLKVSIHSARPGVIIGRRGADIDRLREDLQNLTQKEVFVEIKEVKNPAIDAQLISESIAFQLERRISVKRAMKRALQQAKDAGIEGIKILCRGRLGGSEIARKEGYRYGKIPLQTFRADIDYGFAEAHTTYGLIGVKTWVYKGEKIPTKVKEAS